MLILEMVKHLMQIATLQFFKWKDIWRLLFSAINNSINIYEGTIPHMKTAAPVHGAQWLPYSPAHNPVMTTDK